MIIEFNLFYNPVRLILEYQWTRIQSIRIFNFVAWKFYESINWKQILNIFNTISCKFFMLVLQPEWGTEIFEIFRNNYFNWGKVLCSDNSESSGKWVMVSHWLIILAFGGFSTNEKAIFIFPCSLINLSTVLDSVSQNQM